LPLGPELFDAEQPVITDNTRPATHQFKGYSLDAKRRPTLRYEFGAIAVEDYFLEFADDTTGKIQLRRRVTFTSTEGSNPLRFRLASGDRIVDEAGVYQIGNGLRIRVVSDQKATVEGGQLYLPLKFNGQQTQEVVVEYLWE